MIDRIAALANRDRALARWGRRMHQTFMVEVGEQQYLVEVADGKVQAIDKGPFVMRRWSFAIRASRESWENHWRNPPPPGWHDLFALLRRGEVRFAIAASISRRRGRGFRCCACIPPARTAGSTARF